MLAGGPEIIFFTWLILLALWTQQLIKNEFPRKAFWRFPVVILLVILLAAAQLFPFLDLVAHSQRQTGFADLRWSLPGHGLANFLLPMAFGHILGEGIFFQNGQYWTSSYYLGMAALCLALLAFWKNKDRRVWLFGAFIFVAILFAFGANTPVLPFFRKVIPQISFVTYPIKYLLLVAFIVPLLAAFSLARIREQHYQKCIIFIGTVFLLLLGMIFFEAYHFSLSSAEVHALWLNGLLRLVFLILAVAILFILAGKSEGALAKIAPLVLIILTWLDVMTHEPAQNPTVPPSVYQLNLARQKLAMKPQPEPGGSRAMVSPKAYMQFIQMALLDPKNNYLAKRLGYCGDCNLLDGVPKVDGFFSLTTRENNNLFSLIYGATNDYRPLDDFLGVSEITAPDEIYDWQPRTTFLPLVTAGQKPLFLTDAETLQALTDSHFDGRKMVFLPPEAKPLVTVTNQTEARVLSTVRNPRNRF